MTCHYLNQFSHLLLVLHICVSISSGIGLSPVRRQAITWTNVHLLSIGPVGTNCSEIQIKIQIIPFKKMHLKMLSVKWRTFCPGEMSWCLTGPKRVNPSLLEMMVAKLQKATFIAICQWKLLILTIFYLQFVLWDVFDGKSSLVWKMACRQKGDKPLYKPVMIQFRDAYMGYSGETSQNKYNALVVCLEHLTQSVA